MLFKLLLLGFYADASYAEDMWDKAEVFPGCWIIRREILKAVKGQDFFYTDPKTLKRVDVAGVDEAELNHYVQLWDDFHFLRFLPHGKGTLAERRWVIDIIKIFEKTFIEMENFAAASAMKQ